MLLNKRGIVLVVVSLITFIFGQDAVTAIGGETAIAGWIDKIILLATTIIATFTHTRKSGSS